MNNLEAQSRTWAPRRPSPKLKKRLFGRPAAAITHHASRIRNHPSPAFRFGWLAPATAGVLALCLLSNQRNSDVISGARNSVPLVAMILSNQSPAAYLPGNFERHQNRLPADTFEWTNRSSSTSSIGSLSGQRGKN